MITTESKVRTSVPGLQPAAVPLFARSAGPLAIAAGVLLVVGQVIWWPFDQQGNVATSQNNIFSLGSVVYFAGFCVLMLALIGVHGYQASKAGRLGTFGFSAAILGTMPPGPRSPPVPTSARSPDLDGSGSGSRWPRQPPSSPGVCWAPRRDRRRPGDRCGAGPRRTPGSCRSGRVDGPRPAQLPARSSVGCDFDRGPTAGHRGQPAGHRQTRTARARSPRSAAPRRIGDITTVDGPPLLRTLHTYLLR